MQKAKHDKICKAVSWGKMRNLEHQVTHRRGTVMSCTDDGFNVTIDGEKSHWSTQNTEPEK